MEPPAQGGPRGEGTEGGSAIVQQPPDLLARARRSLVRHGQVWLISALVFTNGSVDVLTGLRIHVHRAHSLEFALPFGLEHWSRTAGIVIGFVLIFLSFQLFRQRKAAWWMTTALLVVLVVVHLLSWRRAYLAFGAVVLLALLLTSRGRFTVRSDPRRIRQGLVMAVATLLLAGLWGTVAFYVLDERVFGHEIGFGEALLRTLRQFVFAGNPDLEPMNAPAHWFLGGITALAVTAQVLAVVSLFRPVAFRLLIDPQERRRARALLTEYGRSSYDYFKVWPDKALYFPTPRSFVGFRVHHGVAVALGDPIAPAEELEKAVEGFRRYARDNGWTAAFVLPEELELYHRLGLQLVKVGEEATIDLVKFQESTSDNKYFRQVARKMEERGAQFSRHVPPHPEGLIDELMALSSRWLQQAHYREFGFWQGTIDRDYLGRSNLDILRDAEGGCIAFINEIPSYKAGEAGFDMMRRLPDAHWAAMDYLFLRMLLALAAEGYRTFDFGLAPFAGVGGDPDSNLLERTIHGVAPRIQKLVRSEGLTQYKRKYEPTWDDRYIAFDGGPLLLPQVALALTTIGLK